MSTHKLRRRSSINEVDDFAMSQAVGSVPEPTVGSSEDRAEAMELDDVDNEERENVQPLEGRKSNDVSASELATHSNVEGCSQLMDGSTSARRTRRSLAIVDPNPQVSATVAPAISTRHGLKSTGQIILIGEDVLTEEGSRDKRLRNQMNLFRKFVSLHLPRLAKVESLPPRLFLCSKLNLKSPNQPPHARAADRP